MINILIWLAPFLCPNPTHSIQQHGNCPLFHANSASAMDGDEEGPGETGGTPKPPIPPPPPPPPGGGQ